MTFLGFTSKNNETSSEDKSPWEIIQFPLSFLFSIYSMLGINMPKQPVFLKMKNLRNCFISLGCIIPKIWVLLIILMRLTII